MRKAGKAGVKEDLPTNGLIGKRKLYLAALGLVVLLVGLVLLLAFKQLSDAKWNSWVYATAGVCGAYITGNLVSKAIDREQ